MKVFRTLACTMGFGWCLRDKKIGPADLHSADPHRKKEHAGATPMCSLIIVIAVLVLMQAWAQGLRFR